MLAEKNLPTAAKHVRYRVNNFIVLYSFVIMESFRNYLKIFESEKYENPLDLLIETLHEAAKQVLLKTCAVFELEKHVFLSIKDTLYN